MVFPAAHLSLPMEAVPRSALRHGVAVRATRLPLSPHCNPVSVSRMEQPRCFPLQSVRFFSLFCKSGFREQGAARSSGRRQSSLTSHSPHPRKAGYVCTQRYAPERERCTALQVHNLLRTQAESTTMGVRLRTRAGLHGNRVGVTMPLEIALSPQARKARFPPAPTQNWAYQAGTRGFTDVPFRGFLGPP